MDSLNDYANKSLKPMEGGPEMVVHYTDANGKSRIKGGSGLKSSQAYPRLLLVSNTHGTTYYSTLVCFFNNHVSTLK